jgi:cellulose synthase/poly-beta-1,6-N-acetylglucosamine synthase-like glycosyltransferase
VSFAIELLGWLLVSVFALISSAFIIETFLGLLPRPAAIKADGPAPSAVVLVPAHNEASIIGGTISALQKHLPAGARILVVADNCSDETAAIARAAGAEVVARADPDRRGKGHALDFGRSHLRASPPDIVLVFDADCTTDAASIRRLLAVSATLKVPAQAKYLLKADLRAAPMVQISNFAFMIKNEVRQLGASRLGAAAVLTGTGMAFPWTTFDSMTLSAGSVEDLDLTIDLISRGIEPVFEPDATVLSEPAALSASVMQRDRWERGFLSAARHASLPLFGRALRERKLPLLWLSLHLLTPPLALLVVLAFLSTFLLALLRVTPGMSSGPLVAQVALLLAIAALVGAAWAMKGRDYVSLATLLRIPLYILWKLPIYARMLTGAERGWNRTDRG